MYIFGRLENDLYKYDNYRDPVEEREKIIIYKKGTWLLLKAIFNDKGVALRCDVIATNTGNIDNPEDISITDLYAKHPLYYDSLSLSRSGIHEHYLDPLPGPYLSNVILMNDDVELKEALFKMANAISAYNDDKDDEE